MDHLKKKTKIKSTWNCKTQNCFYEIKYIILRLWLPQGKNHFSQEVNRRLSFEYRGSTQGNSKWVRNINNTKSNSLKFKDVRFYKHINENLVSVVKMHSLCVKHDLPLSFKEPNSCTWNITWFRIPGMKVYEYLQPRKKLQIMV